MGSAFRHSMAVAAMLVGIFGLALPAHAESYEFGDWLVEQFENAANREAGEVRAATASRSASKQVES